LPSSLGSARTEVVRFFGCGGLNRLGRAVPAQEPGSNRRTTLGCTAPPLCGRFLLKTSIFLYHKF
jgi:hypothetical protein